MTDHRDTVAPSPQQPTPSQIQQIIEELEQPHEAHTLARSLEQCWPLVKAALLAYSPQQPTKEARYTVSPLDWRLLLSSLIHFGKSTDGCLERDLIASIENALTAATDKARREALEQVIDSVALAREQASRAGMREAAKMAGDIEEVARALIPQNPGDAEAQEGENDGR